MIPIGAIINALGITIGGLVGLAFGARLPERVRAIVFQGLGLCVLVIGFKMALLTQNPLIVIFSIVIGSVAGEMIGLEARLIRVGEWLKGRLKSSNPLFTEGMVNASVLFCIGAMAIIGSFDEGLRGDRAVVLSKTIIDSFAALAMASAYGLGALFSARSSSASASTCLRLPAFPCRTCSRRCLPPWACARWRPPLPEPSDRPRMGGAPGIFRLTCENGAERQQSY